MRVTIFNTSAPLILYYTVSKTNQYKFEVNTEIVASLIASLVVFTVVTLAFNF